MRKHLRQFVREYRQLGLVILALIIGGGLDLSGRDNYSHIILGATALLSAIPLATGMVEDLRSGKYGVDILALTAIVSSVLLGQYWAGMIIVLMLTGGKALEDYAEARAKTELSSLLKRKPKQAHLLKAGKTRDVAISQIQVGDKVVIYPGEVIPVDGAVIEGSSSLDESSLTGEAIPVDKTPGDTVMSGAVNVEGALTVKATHTAADSQYEQIIKLVKSAASAQSPFVRLADRYSIPFTALAFLIAGGVWIVSGDPIRFLEVIVVATPCPLLLGAPIALISGMSRSAKHGIIVKTGSTLEKLAEIETIAFDKTGTLTRGLPVVQHVATYHSFRAHDIVAAAAALEQTSTHILAQAIINYASKTRLKVSKAKQVKEYAGLGLSGRLQGKSVLVGRFQLLQDHTVTLPASFSSKAIKQTATYVAIDGKLAGIISFADEVRPEAKTMLARLKRLGIKHTLMVTGDNAATAQAIAKQLGIEEVKAECLPADKIRAIEAVTHKPVAFVGDGVNDAPVLTASDVGIALGARGSTAASESADVVIMLDDVSKVADSLEIARRTFFIAKQSILMGIFISLGLMVVFASGRFKAVHGAALQEVVDVAVIINALRAHTDGKRHKRT
jgi:heavy metal translocating P-type ATPase